MITDLALGLRLAVGGGRLSGSALLRLVVTTVGIALVVSVLLLAASVRYVLDQRDERRSVNQAIETVRPGVDPLLVRDWSLEFHGRCIRPRFIAATGPTSPVPPGLDRLPAPGEVVVSPAVRRLLESPNGAALRGRIPGTVVGVIGGPGISDVGDETMFIGMRPEQIAGEDEPERIYGFDGRSAGFAPTVFALTVPAPVAVVLSLPLLLFVTTVSRMGAAQRDRRLAALRLIGLNARRARRVAVGESLVGAMAGLAVGVGTFLVLRVWIGDLNLFGFRVYGRDFAPTWSSALLIVLLVPALAVGSALFGLRRVIVEPLAVVRAGTPIRRRMVWRWAAVFLGAGMMISTLFAEKDSGDIEVPLTLTLGSALSLMGVAAVLPWAVERLTRGSTTGRHRMKNG